MADLDEAAGGWPTGSLIFRPATRAVPLANEQDKQRQLAKISGFLLSLSLSLFYCAYRSQRPKGAASMIRRVGTDFRNGKLQCALQ